MIDCNWKDLAASRFLEDNLLALSDDFLHRQGIASRTDVSRSWLSTLALDHFQTITFLSNLPHSISPYSFLERLIEYANMMRSLLVEVLENQQGKCLREDVRDGWFC